VLAQSPVLLHAVSINAPVSGVDAGRRRRRSEIKGALCFEPLNVAADDNNNSSDCCFVVATLAVHPSLSLNTAQRVTTLITGWGVLYFWGRDAPSTSSLSAPSITRIDIDRYAYLHNDYFRSFNKSNSNGALTIVITLYCFEVLDYKKSNY